MTTTTCKTHWIRLQDVVLNHISINVFQCETHGVKQMVFTLHGVTAQCETPCVRAESTLCNQHWMEEKKKRRTVLALVHEEIQWNLSKPVRLSHSYDITHYVLRLTMPPVWCCCYSNRPFGLLIRPNLICGHKIVWIVGLKKSDVKKLIFSSNGISSSQGLSKQSYMFKLLYY